MIQLIKRIPIVFIFTLVLIASVLWMAQADAASEVSLSESLSVCRIAAMRSNDNTLILEVIDPQFAGTGTNLLSSATEINILLKDVNVVQNAKQAIIKKRTLCPEIIGTANFDLYKWAENENYKTIHPTIILLNFTTIDSSGDFQKSTNIAKGLRIPKNI